MNSKSLFLILLVIVPLVGFTQNQSDLDSFSNLIDGKWLTEGEWANGAKFKQEIDFEWGLNRKIVKVKTYGTVDPKTGEYGLRNEGIRAWNTKDSVIQFWEFDIFGGVTKGICYFKDKNLHYEYEYHGERLKESWLFVDENTYQYQIVNLVNGKSDKMYMKSTYHRMSE